MWIILCVSLVLTNKIIHKKQLNHFKPCMSFSTKMCSCLVQPCTYNLCNTQVITVYMIFDCVYSMQVPNKTEAWNEINIETYNTFSIFVINFWNVEVSLLKCVYMYMHMCLDIGSGCVWEAIKHVLFFLRWFSRYFYTARPKLWKGGGQVGAVTSQRIGWSVNSVE